MTTRMMKPYANRFPNETQKVFNYRLSRARRIIENCFGILASRFRVFQGEIRTGIAGATDITLAACTLHNILRRHHGRNSLPPRAVDSEDVNYRLIPGSWRRGPQGLVGLNSCRSRNASNEAKAMRDRLATHFMSAEGEVDWQYNSIRDEVDRIVEGLH